MQSPRDSYFGYCRPETWHDGGAWDLARTPHSLRGLLGNRGGEHQDGSQKMKTNQQTTKTMDNPVHVYPMISTILASNKTDDRNDSGQWGKDLLGNLDWEGSLGGQVSSFIDATGADESVLINQSDSRGGAPMHVDVPSKPLPKHPLSHTMPYHAPVYLAQKRGYFEEEGIRVCIVQPSDPSDVAELVGCGKAELGLKPMLHTMAAKARGDCVKSIGTLLDEPFTGLVYLKGSGITSDFASLRGKRIGFPVGQISKLQVDELCKYYGLEQSQYQPIRCGMNISQALIRGKIDAGIGLENVQMVELAEWLVSKGRPREDVQMLRIDELAKLGCCCFCTVLYIGSETFLAQNPEKVRKFMRACKKATDLVLTEPELAYREFMELFPHLDTSTGKRIYERSFGYISESMANNQRDWEKVTAYGKRLGMMEESFQPNYTNEFLDWSLPDFRNQDPVKRQQLVAENQRFCAAHGGCRRVPDV